MATSRPATSSATCSPRGAGASAMAAGVIAPREAGEEGLPRPPQLAHADLGRVVRAHDPALEVVEAVAQRPRRLRLVVRRGHGLARPPVALLAARVGGGGGGEQLDLLRLVQRLPRMA